MSITAKLVQELRQITGAGMMDCKNVLVETNGNIEQGIKLLRERSVTTASKKAGRIAANGMIAIASSSDKQHAVMVEVNCETDFVARDENFAAFSNKLAQSLLAHPEVTDLPLLYAIPFSTESLSVEEARQQLIAKIGENIQIRRFERIDSEGIVGSYLHGTSIGVLVSVTPADEGLARDLAMHIAATRPLVVSSKEVPDALIQNERDIYAAQAKETGKPQPIIEKMIQGRVDKYIAEVCLEGQPFVKNTDILVGALLTDKKAKVLRFVCFEAGEGIEKKEENFFEEVMAQVGDR